jgi:high-affinity iron transporter
MQIFNEVIMLIRRYIFSLLLTLILFLSAAMVRAEDNNVAMILHMLDYIAVDYPNFVKNGKVLDQNEYKEQLEFAEHATKLINVLPDKKEKTEFKNRAEALVKAIENKSSGTQVAQLANTLRLDLIKTYQVKTAPTSAPDLKQGLKLFEAQCASCHGMTGYGDGVAAKGMDPRPRNFHDKIRMHQISAYSAYNTITLGVEGTPMPSFKQLSDDERWALAFLVTTFSADEKEKGEAAWKSGKWKSTFPDLHAIANKTTQEFSKTNGEEAAHVLAYLRTAPQLVSVQISPIETTRIKLDESIGLYKSGKRDAAYQTALTAYLEGFELIEKKLDAVDGKLRTTVEAEMIAYRNMLRTDTPIAQVEQQAEKIRGLLQQTEQLIEGSQASATTTGLSSFIILLREGLEAILVLASIIAFVRKTGRRDTLPYIHAGWIFALILGAITWIISQYFVSISGASREMMEGVAALFASAMLLYVGYWLHDKMHAQQWQKYIKDQLANAMSRKTIWAMAFVSFLAVYREAFETVLFYQTLWMEAGPEKSHAVLLGFGAAALCLAIVTWGIFKASVRLPIGLFFKITSALLIILAVIFAGKGVAALQSADTIAATAVNFPAIPLLGVYPNLQALSAQLLVLILILFGYLMMKRKNKHSGT